MTAMLRSYYLKSFAILILCANVVANVNINIQLYNWKHFESATGNNSKHISERLENENRKRLEEFKDSGYCQLVLPISLNLMLQRNFTMSVYKEFISAASQYNQNYWNTGTTKSSRLKIWLVLELPIAYDDRVYSHFRHMFKYMDKIIMELVQSANSTDFIYPGTIGGILLNFTYSDNVATEEGNTFRNQKLLQHACKEVSSLTKYFPHVSYNMSNGTKLQNLHSPYYNNATSHSSNEASLLNTSSESKRPAKSRQTRLYYCFNLSHYDMNWNYESDSKHVRKLKAGTWNETIREILTYWKDTTNVFYDLKFIVLTDVSNDSNLKVNGSSMEPVALARGGSRGGFRIRSFRRVPLPNVPSSPEENYGSVLWKKFLIFIGLFFLIGCCCGNDDD